MSQDIYIRYSAFFAMAKSSAPDERPEIDIRSAEFFLSLTSVDLFVASVMPTKVIIYTEEQYRSSFLYLPNIFPNIDFDIIPVDTKFPEIYRNYREFTKKIVNKATVDDHCIVRMLLDFSCLPTDVFRLLIGTDVVFFKYPQELASFCAQKHETGKVVYMIDNATWLGVPYRLRYYNGPMLEGLLGDFYCLSPGVSLSVEDIKECLLTVDAWPLEPSRFSPSSNIKVAACEQMTAAILLARFEAQQLPIGHYSAIGELQSVPFHDELKVIYSHRALSASGEWPKILRDKFHLTFKLWRDSLASSRYGSKKNEEKPALTATG